MDRSKLGHQSSGTHRTLVSCPRRISLYSNVLLLTWKFLYHASFLLSIRHYRLCRRPIDRSLLRSSYHSKSFLYTNCHLSSRNILGHVLFLQRKLLHIRLLSQLALECLVRGSGHFWNLLYSCLHSGETKYLYHSACLSSRCRYIQSHLWRSFYPCHEFDQRSNSLHISNHLSKYEYRNRGAFLPFRSLTNILCFWPINHCKILCCQGRGSRQWEQSISETTLSWYSLASTRSLSL